MILYGVVIALAVLADQLSKLAVLRFLPAEGDSVTLLPGVLRFTHVDNTGAALGMLKDARWVFMIVSAVAVAAMLVYLIRQKPGRFAGISLSLLIAGGIGNMIDRIFRGYVVDFVDFCAFPAIWKYVFNVADICVCVGCALLLLAVLLAERADRKKAAVAADAGKTAAAAAADNTAAAESGNDNAGNTDPDNDNTGTDNNSGNPDPDNAANDKKTASAAEGDGRHAGA